jgi:hypothetical protein
MALALACRLSSFHSTRTVTGITGVGHFTVSAPVGAPDGVIVTATEGKMPTVRETDAKAKQTARLMVGKVTTAAAKARSRLIVGKARQTAANQMGVAKPTVAKATRRA